MEESEDKKLVSTTRVKHSDIKLDEISNSNTMEVYFLHVYFVIELINNQPIHEMLYLTLINLVHCDKYIT